MIHLVFFHMDLVQSLSVRFVMPLCSSLTDPHLLAVEQPSKIATIGWALDGIVVGII